MSLSVARLKCRAKVARSTVSRGWAAAAAIYGTGPQRPCNRTAFELVYSGGFGDVERGLRGICGGLRTKRFSWQRP